ncbi:DMT family transporter [Vibrio mangrovi]|uniref:EamA family transporter n=1 Tax=Vibrio mangrovi TaxID=474394 RepID=A0A1Y6IV09_9VIBR|nr:EamA family transporter [Vibrio mangrovi]MDW6004553.1 EamA family transporter [Vibrio mangrovi]SMS00841.1 putative inner membrane transporter YedA [Vibrio mangrovi]
MSYRDSGISGVLCVMLASVFWGTTGTAVSFIPDVSPLATGAFATGMGGLLLLWNARRHLLADRKQFIARPGRLILGAISVATYPLSFYSAVKLSGVATGTLISLASAPFFTVLLERLISKKAISSQWGISFLVGVSGIVLLILGQENHIQQTDRQKFYVWGICLGLVAGLSYAVYAWFARQMIEQGISSKSSMASMFGGAAILLLPSLVFTGKNAFSDIQHVTIMLYMAFIPMFLGYLCFGYALKQIDAAKATLITLFEPVVATLLAVWIVRETFTTIGWYGMTLIILCLILQTVKWPAEQIRRTAGG